MGRPDGLPDAGIPTDETDALWEDLYQCTSLPLTLFLPLPFPNPSFNPPATNRPFLVNSRHIRNSLLGRTPAAQRHGVDPRQRRPIHSRAGRVPSAALPERHPQDLFPGAVSECLQGLLARGRLASGQSGAELHQH